MKAIRAGFKLQAPLVLAAAALLAMVGAPAPASAQTAPPPNDDFPGLGITELPFSHTVDATDATLEPGESAPFEATVWYNFTPAEDSFFSADAGDGSVTALCIKTEAELDEPGACIGNYGTCGAPGGARFEASGGATIWIQVARDMSAAPTGEIGFRLRENPHNAPIPCPAPFTPMPPSIELPGTGGPPPAADGRWPWVLVLAGGSLAALTSSVVLVMRSRPQK